MPGGEQEGGPRSLQELTDIAEGLAGRVVQLEEMIAGLAGHVAELVAAPAKPDTVRPWLTLDDPELGADMLTMLARWLDDVWNHYPGHGGERVLPPCWARHPWLVEELWAARGAWRDAVGASGSYSKLVDFHERTRPGLAKRIAENTGTCDVHKHETGSAVGRADQTPVDTSDLDDVAFAWTSTRTIMPAAQSTP